ncbi:hypothetical protein GCM10009797_33020 [Nocardioides hwasunensis]
MPGRVLAAATGAAVALALLSAPATARAYDKPGRASTFDLGAPIARSTNGSGVLVAQSAVPTVRPAGYPLPGATPGQTLAGATVAVSVAGETPTYFPSASVTLAGAPGSYDGRVRLGMGLANGTSCDVVWTGDTRLYPDTTTYSLNGGYNPDYFPTPARPFECAVVELRDGETSLDALIGTVTSTYESPALSIGDLELLGGTQRQLKLVRGVPTKVSLEIHNTGKVAARDVVVGGAGKGIKVSSETIESVAPGTSASVGLTVRLTGKKAGRLTLTAAGGEVSASRRMKVKQVRPPAPPRAGTYRDKSGSVRFSIRKGRIVGWSGTMQTTCGGYGTPPTYTQNTYDFPRTRIPRNGIVQATEKGSNYTTHLQLKVAGARVTKGSFSYFGPAGCRASTSFTAKPGR